MPRTNCTPGRVRVTPSLATAQSLAPSPADLDSLTQVSPKGRARLGGRVARTGRREGSRCAAAASRPEHGNAGSAAGVTAGPREESTRPRRAEPSPFHSAGTTVRLCVCGGKSGDRQVCRTMSDAAKEKSATQSGPPRQTSEPRLGLPRASDEPPRSEDVALRRSGSPATGSLALGRRRNSRGPRDTARLSGPPAGTLGPSSSHAARPTEQTKEYFFRKTVDTALGSGPSIPAPSSFPREWRSGSPPLRSRTRHDAHL